MATVGEETPGGACRNGPSLKSITGEMSHIYVRMSNIGGFSRATVGIFTG